MSMHENQYHISNSEMNDWKEMCPIAWKAKHIDRNPLFWEESEEITAMDWGVLFETLAIGSGVSGKTIPEEKLAKMKKSEYYNRVYQQAKECRAYFKVIGGKIIARQPYLFTSIVNEHGQRIYICGGLDLLIAFEDRNKIIDTKLTGDNDNDFGKYQFGNPDKINPQQAVHYTVLHLAFYNKEADFSYFVFDKSPSMKQKVIDVEVSEIGKLQHIEKVSVVFNEITMAMELDDWEYRNTFSNCRSCPLECVHRRTFPDIVTIQA